MFPICRLSPTYAKYAKLTSLVATAKNRGQATVVGAGEQSLVEDPVVERPGLYDTWEANAAADGSLDLGGLVIYAQSARRRRRGLRRFLG